MHCCPRRKSVPGPTSASKLILLVSLTVLSAYCDVRRVHADSAAARPNVILFLADDLGWRDLGCYGSPFHETPNIDRLAENGIRFTQAYATCHVCSPTRASIMTGKYPARLKMTDWLPGRKDYDFQRLKNATIRQYLPLEEITLAEALKKHGYRTAHLGKWHLGEDPHGPLAQGFDVQIPRWNKGWPKAGYHAPFQLDGLADKPGDYLTDRLTDEAESFIESNQDQPFFLYLSHFAVHDPIQGRNDLVQKYQRKLQNGSAPDGPAFVLEGNPDDIQPLTRDALTDRLGKPKWSGYSILPRRTVKIKQHQDNVQFAGMVESLDESLGRIVSKLRELQLERKTLVILFSDNGGMSGANFGRPSRKVAADQLDLAFSTSNLPLRGAKGWLYEGGIREPLIVSWPGNLPSATVNETPVISTDLFPTVLDLAGLPLQPDQHQDGRSLVPLLRNEASGLQRKALFWHFPHYSNHGMQSPGGAIRVGDHKLLEYYENHSVQLFNLKDDIGEQHDLAASQVDRVNELREQLHEWQRTVAAEMMPTNPNYQPATSR